MEEIMEQLLSLVEPDLLMEDWKAASHIICAIDTTDPVPSLEEKPAKRWTQFTDIDDDGFVVTGFKCTFGSGPEDKIVLELFVYASNKKILLMKSDYNKVGGTTHLYSESFNSFNADKFNKLLRDNL